MIWKGGRVNIYLRTTLTNQDPVDGEIMSKLEPGDAWYRSVYNLWSSSLPSIIYRLTYTEYDFAFCFVWVWNLVAYTEGGKQTEDVRE
jgi:hypothetical protein